MKRLFYRFAYLLPLCLLSACAQDLPALREEAAGMHRCELQLDGRVTGFSAATKADGDFAFSNSNRLYLRMVAGERVVLGEATYDEDSGVWTLTYSGMLDGAAEGSAAAVLFGKTYSVAANRVYLDYRTPIFEDPDARFAVSEAGISLTAELRPKTGRLSFVHDMEEGRWFRRIAGLSFYDSFDLAAFSFSEKDAATQDGFSFPSDGTDDEYFYGFFSTPDDPYILFLEGSSCYIKYFLPSVLAPGQSGYVARRDDIFWNYDYYYSTWLGGFNGSTSTSLSMRYVPAGTFSMGNDSDREASPAHAVTLSHYYIGESEVTKEMWYNVMGEPSSYANNPEPVYYRSYDEIQRFIEALNRKTGHHFRLPTEAEWEFAARGGIFTRGCKYSGSNNLDQVANRSSNVVKTKESNELDLYDMSGNLAELCNDWYAPYSAGAVSDPTGPENGEFRVVRGGYRYDSEDRFTVWARTNTAVYGGESSDRIGFRLAMDVPLTNL